MVRDSWVRALWRCGAQDPSVTPPHPDTSAQTAEGPRSHSPLSGLFPGRWERGLLEEGVRTATLCMYYSEGVNLGKELLGTCLDTL